MNRALRILLVTLASVVLCGCQATKKAYESAKSYVLPEAAEIPVGDGVTVQLQAARFKRHYKQGVGFLTVSKVDEAVQELKMAVEDDPKDWRTRFALGVAYELKGEYKLADETYSLAQSRLGTERDPQIEAAVNRVRSHLK
jgi:Flp pilus assembly protein TadD